MDTAMVMAKRELSKKHRRFPFTITDYQGVDILNRYYDWWKVPIGILLVILTPTSFFEARSQIQRDRAPLILFPLITTPDVTRPSPEKLLALMRREVDAVELKRHISEAQRRLLGEPYDARALYVWSMGQSSSSGFSGLMLAHRISRRNPVVELELARRFALANQLRTSIDHLDVAMTVSPEIAFIINRQLAMGIVDQRLERILTKFSHRPWYPQLVQQIAMHTPNPEEAATFLIKSNIKLDEVPKDVAPALLHRLANEFKISAAQQFVEMYGHFDVSEPRQFGLSTLTVNPEFAPFSWVFEARFINYEYVGRSKYALTVDVPAGYDGNFATRVTSLPPGRYDFKLLGASDSTDFDVVIKLNCLNESGSLEYWNQPVMQNGGKLIARAPLTIPASCGVQGWSLFVSNFSGSSPGRLTVSDLVLKVKR